MIMTTFYLVSSGLISYIGTYALMVERKHTFYKKVYQAGYKFDQRLYDTVSYNKLSRKVTDVIRYIPFINMLNEIVGFTVDIWNFKNDLETVKNNYFVDKLKPSEEDLEGLDIIDLVDDYSDSLDNVELLYHPDGALEYKMDNEKCELYALRGIFNKMNYGDIIECIVASEEALKEEMKIINEIEELIKKAKSFGSEDAVSQATSIEELNNNKMVIEAIKREIDKKSLELEELENINQDKLSKLIETKKETTLKK